MLLARRLRSLFSATSASTPKQLLQTGKGRRSAISTSSAPTLSVASVSARSRGGGGRDTIGRRLLSLVYPKRSAVIALRKWAEEGKSIPKYQLNCVVRELRKLKRFKHGLEICEWMTSQPYIKLLPGDYAVHLDLIAKVRGLDSTEEFFADLPKRMKTRSTFTALLNAYVQNKLPTKAEFLMQVMASRGFLSSCLPFNHMLNLYISTGQLDKVPEVINELKKNCTPNQYTYNLLLTACADKDDSNGAEEVILEMKTYKISPDWVTFSILTGIYMKSGNLNKAREALEEMENRVSRKDRVAFPSLITLHASLSDKENVLRIWKNMKLMFRKMSDTEYKCILASLVKLDDIETAEIVYDEWDSVTGTRDSRISNILLAYYAKNDMSKAEEFHEQTAKSGINHSYTTWETLALGYLHVNRMDKALDCLRKAFSSAWKWEPNIELVRAVFQGLKKNGDADGGEQFLVMLRDAGYVTTEVYNMLLLTYVEARKMPLIVIERMKKDQVSLDEETHRLLRLTSRFCIGSASTLISS